MEKEPHLSWPFGVHCNKTRAYQKEKLVASDRISARNLICHYAIGPSSCILVLEMMRPCKSLTGPSKNRCAVDDMDDGIPTKQEA